MTTKTSPKTKSSNKMTVKTAQLEDQIAAFLVPDYNDGQKLAIVDEGVLKYLKDLLPLASAEEIVGKFIRRLELLVDYKPKAELLELAVKEAKEFVAFHTSVNLLNQYFDPSISKHVEEPFNVEKELTLDELLAKEKQMQEDMEALVTQIRNHPDYNMPQAVPNKTDQYK